MPSMMENIVMKKCKVKFKLARTIVVDARNNMPQENRNCLWSKALEEECLRIYYDQYGVKLGLTWPSVDPMGESNHTQETASTFSTTPVGSMLRPKQVSTDEGRPDGTALKKSRSIGKIKLRPEPIHSPTPAKETERTPKTPRKTPTKPTVSPRKRRTLTEQTSFSEAGESESSELGSSRRSRSVSRRRVKKGEKTDSDQLDHSSHSTRSVSRRRVKKDDKSDSEQLDHSSHSTQSAKSTSSRSRSKSTKSKKKASKKTSSILEIEPSQRSTPRKKSLNKSTNLTEQNASELFLDLNTPMSPSLAEYISSPPKYSSSSKLSQRLAAGMKGMEAPASRDTTPFKPKVDKSPKKTPRKQSLVIRKSLPSDMLGAESAILRALGERKDSSTSGEEPSSPTRIFIRCKRTKPKSLDRSNHDDDNQSIGPEDLMKHSPEGKSRGSMASLGNSRFLDGNSSKTRMVPVVRQSSGGGSPAQRRRDSYKLRNSYRKDEDSPHMSSRQVRRGSAPESTLFSEGFLVSPSRETSMDNFQRSSGHGKLTRQDSADSFLSVESFSTSDSNLFDSPAQKSLSNTLPCLPTLSPPGGGKNDCHIAFDSETVSSSLAAPKKPKRQTSTKATRRSR